MAPDQRGYSPGARPSRVEDYALPLLIADVIGLADAEAGFGADRVITARFHDAFLANDHAWASRPRRSTIRIWASVTLTPVS